MKKPVDKRPYIEHLQAHHKEHTGEEISYMQAALHFDQLVLFVRTVVEHEPRSKE